MELEVISMQSDTVVEAVNDFVVNLLMAVGIVFIVLLIFMGIRSGLIIGFVLFLKPGKSEDAGDPYDSAFYRGYKRLLIPCLRYRLLSILFLAGLLGASLFMFRFVENSFFPNSTRPQFMVDAWLPVGTRMDQTAEASQEMLKTLQGIEGVKNITTTIGQGAPRFLLTYSPERFDTGYAQFLVDVEDHTVIDTALPKAQQLLTEQFPDGLFISKRFLLGPGEGGRIQIRFSGEDQDELRRLANEAMEILHQDGGAVGVRIDAREQVPILRPQFSEAQARLAGITRTDLGTALEASFSGRRIGLYREGDELLPIVVRNPEVERQDPDLIRDVQVFSPVANGFIPIRQVVTDFIPELEDPILLRRNRLPTIIVHADQASGLASTLHERIRAEIEALPLPAGYKMEWGGEYEDASKAKGALAGTLPAFVLAMVLIVIMLFNSLRITAIIWLTVPLSLIGITVGLLVFGQPFGFMALLGALSLSGMLIKNAIVLLDEVNLQLKGGKDAWNALIDACVSRVRPVSMAALTTMFGLIPLLADVFFGAMAVTIVVGLAFASVLTLFAVPVFYVTFFKVPTPTDHGRPTPENKTPAARPDEDSPESAAKASG